MLKSLKKIAFVCSKGVKMNPVFEKESKVYMVGCGNTEDVCKVYDMKPNLEGVDIIHDGKCICSYSQKDMQKFISIGFATVL